MPKERSIVQRIFIAVVFILLEVAALLMLSHNNQLQRLWIARISHGFMARTWGTNGFNYIPATIIKSSSNTQHNYLIIDKGSEDGVVRNSGVITTDGVIGIVDAVSPHYSYAISFLNTELFISARLGESGAVGPLAWDGTSSDGAILKEIPLQFKFEPGDTVYTSGYSSIFPPDIPIGVAGESKIINGATNEIKVRLFQNHKALKYVTIVGNARAEEIEAIENQEEQQKK